MSFVTGRLNEVNARRDAFLARLSEGRRGLASLLMDREESASVAGALARIRARLKEGLSSQEKQDIARLFIADGVVRTLGQGRRKTAEVVVWLKWGQDVRYGDRPQDQSSGQFPYRGLDVRFSVGLASQLQ
jgi:hypothetical protein